MTHIVAWPAAKFTVHGERVIVQKGGYVPDGVTPEVIAGLLVAGGVVPGPSRSPLDPVDPRQPEHQLLDGPPAKRANVDTWRAYAVEIGLPAPQVADMTKADLITAVEAHLEAHLEDAAHSDEPDGQPAAGDPVVATGQSPIDADQVPSHVDGDAGSPADPDAPTIT